MKSHVCRRRPRHVTLRWKGGSDVMSDTRWPDQLPAGCVKDCWPIASGDSTAVNVTSLSARLLAGVDLKMMVDADV